MGINESTPGEPFQERNKIISLTDGDGPQEFHLNITHTLRGTEEVVTPHRRDRQDITSGITRVTLTKDETSRSGCLRSLTGAKQFCVIRSYLSTAAKHGKHVFDTVVMLAEGRPGPRFSDLTSYGAADVGGRAQAVPTATETLDIAHCRPYLSNPGSRN